jgi:hypothetical protein
MKKLKEVKNLHGIFIDSITELDAKLQNQFKKIKQEYHQNVINEKYKLLVDICNGEGLDFEKLKGKYLKSKELNLVQDEEVVKEKVEIEEDLLDKIEINGKEYYYEAKEKGIVYDLNSKPVGVYKNGKVIFN